MPNFRLLPFLLLPALGVLAGTAPAVAQSGPVGPLTFEEESPLQRISYTPHIEIADPVAPGRFQADLWLGYANIFEEDSTSTHTLFLDMESLLTTMTLRYGLLGGWEVGSQVTLVTTGGGFLDHFLSVYHRALGLSDYGREDYPMNAYHAVLIDGSGRMRLEVPRHTMSVDNVRLFAKWRAYRSRTGRGVVSLRAVGEVPGDRNTIGARRANLALLALGRLSWTRYHLHAMVGASTVRVGSELQPLVHPWAWFLMVGGERSLAPWISAVGEVTAAAPRLRGFRDSIVDGAPINLVLGFAGGVGPGWRWNAGLQEDTPPDRPSVDFTMCLGISRTW